MKLIDITKNSNIQKKIEHVTVNIPELDSMLSFQRQINMEFVNERSKDGVFDSKLVNEVKVSVRADGSKRVCDGQHTIAILKQRGYTEAPCELRYGLTETEEYNWFIQLNKSTQAQTWKRLLTAMMHGDYETFKLPQDMNFLVKKTGLCLDLYDETQRGCRISCTKMLLDKYTDYVKKDKIGNFLIGLKIIAVCFGGDRISLQANFLKGMFKFYDLYEDDLDLRRVSTVFKRLSASKIRDIVNNDKYTDDVTDKYVKVFVKEYNTRLSKEKQLRMSKLEDGE